MNIFSKISTFNSEITMTTDNNKNFFSNKRGAEDYLPSSSKKQKTQTAQSAPLLENVPTIAQPAPLPITPTTSVVANQIQAAPAPGGSLSIASHSSMAQPAPAALTSLYSTPERVRPTTSKFSSNAVSEISISPLSKHRAHEEIQQNNQEVMDPNYDIWAPIDDADYINYPMSPETNDDEEEISTELETQDTTELEPQWIEIELLSEEIIENYLRENAEVIDRSTIDATQDEYLVESIQAYDMQQNLRFYVMRSMLTENSETVSESFEISIDAENRLTHTSLSFDEIGIQDTQNSGLTDGDQDSWCAITTSASSDSEDLKLSGEESFNA